MNAAKQGEIWKAHMEGKTYGQLAIKHEVSRNTIAGLIYRWKRRGGPPLRKGGARECVVGVTYFPSITAAAAAHGITPFGALYRFRSPHFVGWRFA